MERLIEAGDIVIDETSGDTHTIERIEPGIIHLYEEDRVIVINDMWKLEDSPDHVIKFGRGPGNMSMSALMKGRVPHFFFWLKYCTGQM